MAGKGIQGIDNDRQGWWLVAAFAVGNAALLGAATSGTPGLSLVPPALALLFCVAALPHGSWLASGDGRALDGTTRILAGIALTGSWAAAVGAASVGWVATSGATALLLGWIAVLCLTWARLRRLPALSTASLVIAAGLAAAAVTMPGPDGLTLSLAPAGLLIKGLTSTALMPGLMVGGLVLLASSLVQLAKALPRLDGGAAMHSLAVSFAGLCSAALLGTVITSTTGTLVPTGGGELVTLAPVAIGAAASLALLTAGGLTARASAVSRRGSTLACVALLAVITGGRFSLTADGLAVVAALVLVALATTFGLVAGLAAAAGLVRDGHRLRSRFARASARRATAPAAITASVGTSAPPTVATPAIAAARHLTS